MKNLQLEPASFRDRTSQVFYIAEGVYRGLSAQALDDWEALSKTAFFERCTSAGHLVQTERVEAPKELDKTQLAKWTGFLKHQMIPFISYPYEWCFGMLKDAAWLQLDLLEQALDENMTLKDSSAFNFQWQGSKPVFIDIPSFERLKPGEPWVGYRQFCQLFLYPLFLQAYKDVPFQPWLRGDIEGIEPRQCLNLMSLRDLFRRGVVTDVYLHAKADNRFADANRNVRDEFRRAGFSKDLIKANVRRLKKNVNGLKWKRAKTQWSDYATSHRYTATDYRKKEDFVRSVVRSRPWSLTWDLGCNTGSFAKIAAENSAYVIAIDSDQLAIERLYQELKADPNTKILPLIGNAANLSPNLGWRGLERRSFLERGRPNMTLCLALLHHLVISAHITLNELIDWLADMGTDLIIEFITREDPQVQILLRNKVDHYRDYDKAFFERHLGQMFEVARREPLDCGTRILYYAKTRRNSNS